MEDKQKQEKILNIVNTKKFDIPKQPRGITQFDLQLVERSIFLAAQTNKEVSSHEFLRAFSFLKDKLGLDIKPEYIIGRFNHFKKQDNQTVIEELYYRTTPYYHQLAFKGAVFISSENFLKNSTVKEEKPHLLHIGSMLNLNNHQRLSLIKEVQSYNPKVSYTPVTLN